MSDWEIVIGLETHVELKTRTKIFCGCETVFGAAPNSHVCPVCMGLPGALPVLNEKAVELAVKAGLMLGCDIHTESRFDRKNYFYPDLPKAYQISQFFRPICTGGEVVVQTGAGEKRIGVTRIHLEEDAGKLLHGQGGTLLDMNRCGVPLIEIVTEPDIRSAEEAVAYLKKLKALLTYADVSDCRMNEGSLRCDVNLSVRRPGKPFGTRTEMKNLNSFQSVERAIAAESRRQIALVEKGEAIVQETRRYDQKTQQTSALRRKENSDDYRYFPEPDLGEVMVTAAQVAAWRRELPQAPDERRAAYTARYGLSAYAAEQVVSDKARAEFFEQCAKLAPELAVCIANLMLGERFAALPEGEPITVSPAHMAALAAMLQEGRLNSGMGKQVLGEMLRSDCDPKEYAKAHGLSAITDEAALRAIAREVLCESPTMLATYRAGKTKVLQAMMGKCMQKAQGRADAAALESALRKEIAETGAEEATDLGPTC